MLSKKVLKDIQSLGRKKYRQESGLFVAEGPKTVIELLELIPGQVEQLIATEEWIKANEKIASMHNAIEIAGKDLEKITQLQTPNHVLLVAKQSVSKKPDAAGSVILYLDTIQDPGNLGTIIRIADWFGLQSIVCSEGCADCYNPKVIQSSMASIGRINVWYDRDDNWLAQTQSPVLAAVLEGDNVYGHHRISDGVIMIGNESKGLSDEALVHATGYISIPRVGGAESLNAAVATGIILSHLI